LRWRLHLLSRAGEANRGIRHPPSMAGYFRMAGFDHRGPGHRRRDELLVLPGRANQVVLIRSSYKDTFSLPHTETASVATWLEDAGLDNQNGVSGSVVLRTTAGAFTAAPQTLQSRLAGLDRRTRTAPSETAPPPTKR
jgi:hypothetical protein